MAIVSDTVLIKVQMDTADAVRETQKLAAAQEKHAKQAAKAMDDFQRDATAALGKVEKSYQAQAKAAQEAAKAAAAAPGFLDRAAGAMGTFNKVVGFANQTLGAWKTALDLGGVAVDLLGKGLSKLGQAFGSSPDLRMMWEPDPMRGWIDGLKEAEKEADKWAAKIQAVYFGANVDSPHNLERRHNAAAEAKRLKDQEAANVDYLRERQLALQNEREQDRKDRFNHEGKYARKARTGGGFDISSLGGDFGGSVDMEGKWAMSTSGLLNQAQTLLAMGDQLTRNLSDITTGVIGDITAPGGGPRLGKGGQTAAEKQHADYMALLNKPPGPTVLERMFGKPQEIDAYREAWSGFQDALTAGYDAMVTGSEGAGKAIKKALAGAIGGIGKKMFVRGLEETAEGFTNPAHFASAAAFFSGAALAGVIANQVMPGSGGPSSGAGASAGVGASASGVGLGTGSYGGTGSNTTIVLGNGWEDMTPHERSVRMARGMRRANALNAPSRGVLYE